MIFLQPVLIRNHLHSDEGRLAFVDGSLVAILVQLIGEEFAELRGHWFVETGFGPCEVQRQTTFADLDAAKAWISERVTAKTNAA